MPDSQRSVIDILTADHREVEGLFTRLEQLRAASGQDSADERRRLTDRVVIELVRHSVAEEVEVYPRLAAVVSDAEAARSRHEHAEAETLMKRLEGRPTDSAEFAETLDALITQVRGHIEEEEGQIFPQLARVFTPDELAAMGAKVESVKRLAPTRPHPGAPDTPPGDKLLGPVIGLVDRLRDALTGRGSS